MSAQNLIDEAVKDAFKKLDEKKPEEKPEEKEEKEEEVKEEEKEEEEKEEEKEEVVEFDASPETIRNALALFESLNNPAERAKFIQTVAEAAGFDLTKKQDQKEVKKGMKDLLKHHLGDAYDILQGDALAAAIEAAVKNEIGDKVGEIDKKLTERERKDNEKFANDAMDRFFKRNDIKQNDREKVAEALMKKFKVMAPTPGSDIDEYLDDIYAVTQRSAERTKVVKKTVDKIKKNAEERETSGEGSGNDERIKKGSHRPSLDEAVRAAMRNEKLDLN